MKDLTVKILVGIPASGKSTWAKNFVRNNPEWIRINRDDYRLMLKDQQLCEPKIESMINELSDFNIKLALSKKLNVIVDNTNLKASYINQIIDLVRYSANVEFQTFDISLDKAIERDKKKSKTSW